MVSPKGIIGLEAAMTTYFLNVSPGPRPVKPTPGSVAGSPSGQAPGAATRLVATTVILSSSPARISS